MGLPSLPTGGAYVGAGAGGGGGCGEGGVGGGAAGCTGVREGGGGGTGGTSVKGRELEADDDQDDFVLSSTSGLEWRFRNN